MSLFVYEIPFHTPTNPHQVLICAYTYAKSEEATDERMSNQFKPTHSSETVAITSKLKLFGHIKRTSDSRWKNLISGLTDRQQQKKRNTTHNMDGQNIRNPDYELAWP